MSECNAIIEANNEIDRLKRENKKLNGLCMQYGFDMGKLEEENEQLKKKILEEIDLEVAYVDETYSDGRMSKEQHNGAIISLRQLREKFE